MTTNSAPNFAPGAPCWIELSSGDLGAANQFYSQLFGWQAEDQGEQMGHYYIYRQGGQMIAGGMTNPQGNYWVTYVCTQNAEAAANAAREAGGQVIVGPMQVMDLGSMAVVTDPAGAALGIWQPNQHKGSELVNAPFGFCWNELETRDLEAAKRFYPKVFGWGVHSNPMPQGGEYVEWQTDGRSVAGAQAMGPQFPANVPPHWLVYFAVNDTDAIATKAQSLGGKLLAPAMDIPQGRFAVLSDPQGAPFGIIKLNM
jgi:uncharacterized protein